MSNAPSANTAPNPAPARNASSLPADRTNATPTPAKARPGVDVAGVNQSKPAAPPAGNSAGRGEGGAVSPSAPPAPAPPHSPQTTAGRPSAGALTPSHGVGGSLPDPSQPTAPSGSDGAGGNGELDSRQPSTSVAANPLESDPVGNSGGPSRDSGSALASQSNDRPGDQSEESETNDFESNGPEGSQNEKGSGNQAVNSLEQRFQGAEAEAMERAATQMATRTIVLNPAVWGFAVIAFVVLLVMLLLGLAIFGIAGSGSGNGSANQTNDSSTEITGDTQGLAKQILASKNITAQPNPQGSLQAAADGKCSPVPQAKKCSMLDPRMLKTLLEGSEKSPLIITSLTTGDHATCSDHYAGRAADLGVNPKAAELLSIAKKNGATQWGGAVPNPNIADPPNHIHFGWSGKKVCEQ